MFLPGTSRHRAYSFFQLSLALAVCAALLLLAPIPALRADNLTPEASNADTHRVLLPNITLAPATSSTGTRYETVPVGAPPDWCPQDSRPAASHADKNLAWRGYSLTSAPLQLVDYGGSTDDQAPQVPGMFADRRMPRFTAAYRVNDWDWSCGPDGCRSDPLTEYPVTLLGLTTRPGELISPPSRGSEIYGSGYNTLVLYAEERRLTLKYTRDDSVCDGYTVHLEDLVVDANLLALYRSADAAGRSDLPALRNGQPVGTARGAAVLVAIRDKGKFMDPRSRKDWWQGR